MSSYLQQASFDLKEIVKEEENITTYICENTDGILDPLDQMTFALNEIAIKYGPIVVLKNAP
jgi:hypothetical protein